MGTRSAAPPAPKLRREPSIPAEPSITAVSSGEQETVQQQGHLLWERALLRWPELGMENRDIPSHKCLGSAFSVSAVAWVLSLLLSSKISDPVTHQDGCQLRLPSPAASLVPRAKPSRQEPELWHSRGEAGERDRTHTAPEPLTFTSSGGVPKGPAAVLFDPGSARLNQALACVCNHLGALPITRPGSYPFHPALGHLSPKQRGLCLPCPRWVAASRGVPRTGVPPDPACAGAWQALVKSCVLCWVSPPPGKSQCGAVGLSRPHTAAGHHMRGASSPGITEPREPGEEAGAPVPWPFHLSPASLPLSCLPLWPRSLFLCCLCSLCTWPLFPAFPQALPTAPGCAGCLCTPPVAPPPGPCAFILQPPAACSHLPCAGVLPPRRLCPSVISFPSQKPPIAMG